jgi:hypothetical protein
MKYPYDPLYTAFLVRGWRTALVGGRKAFVNVRSGQCEYIDEELDSCNRYHGRIQSIPFYSLLDKYGIYKER